MGSVRRLKKIAKERAEANGHNLGFWSYRKKCGLHVAQCCNCAAITVVFEETEENAKTIKWLVNTKKQQPAWDGFYNKVHPKRSKGTIGGMVLTAQCIATKDAFILRKPKQ